MFLFCMLNHAPKKALTTDDKNIMKPLESKDASDVLVEKTKRNNKKTPNYREISSDLNRIQTIEKDHWRLNA